MKKFLFVLFIAIFVLFRNINVKVDSNIEEYISVEVKGEVKESKIIQVKLGSTLNEILKEVELSEDADLNSISLNMVLYNNQIIVIPKKKNDSISINSATKEDFMTIKGIGESIATRIIEYRQLHGGFRSIEEIKNIKGIGEKTYERIKDHLSY